MSDTPDPAALDRVKRQAVSTRTARQRARGAEQSLFDAIRAAGDAGHGMTAIARAAGLSKQRVHHHLNQEP